MLNLDHIRNQFPGLDRTVNGEPAIFFDGPAGSQVPLCVAENVASTLIHTNANEGGFFQTSMEVHDLFEHGVKAVAALYGTTDRNIVFGANMTTLTLHFTRAIAQTLRGGDEIIVTHLDHDANVSPWEIAARQAGAVIRKVPLNPEDCSLDMSAFESLLGPKTKWVAVGLASNATGGVNPVRTISRLAHRVGAHVFVDAVHYAPHRLIDVNELECDALVSSAYKYFGPHIGMLWARQSLLETLPATKVRPATNDLPFRWMTGTPSYASIAGATAAIEYIASISGKAESLRHGLTQSFQAIQTYEEALLARLIDGLRQFDDLRIWGITDQQAFSARVPTVSFTHAAVAPQTIARLLAEKGIFVWSGNHYALGFTEYFGIEPSGTLRVGLLHYNTTAEVDRFLTALRDIFHGGRG